MFERPANKDIPHEGDSHYHSHSVECPGQGQDLWTIHHSLHRCPPVPVLESTLLGEIAEKKARSSIIVMKVDGNISLEDQEQSGTQGSGDVNEEFPEGGWKAWSVVVGSFFALFSALAILNTIGMS